MDSKPSELNVSGSFNKGWNFRTVLKGESGGTTIFFPASGKRTNSYIFNVLADVGMGGAYWFSTPYNNYQGTGFEMGQYILYLRHGCERMDGFTVRPVAEN